MKKIVLLLFICILHAQKYDINEFEVDLYSKNSQNMQKITMDLELHTQDIADESQLKDTLNIIASSFYVQDLLSSKGKESFKKALRQYALNKYKISIGEVYIISLKLVNDMNMEKLIQLIDEHCKNSNAKKPNTKAVDKLLQGLDSKILENMNFGDVEF